MKNATTILTLTVLVAGLVSCAPRTDADFIGEYVANFNDGQDVIVVKADGRYVHRVRHIANSGTWELTAVRFTAVRLPAKQHQLRVCG